MEGNSSSEDEIPFAESILDIREGRQRPQQRASKRARDSESDPEDASDSGSESSMVVEDSGLTDDDLLSHIADTESALDAIKNALREIQETQAQIQETLRQK